MLRLKILASVTPVLAAVVYAGGGLLPSPHPCIAVSNTSVAMADMPWHADLHVAFTEDPTAATVRVMITESAEAADFALVDGPETAETGACNAGPATHSVSILGYPDRGTPVIYLTHEGPADYRIFVRSKTFSLRDAAALVVGAGVAKPSVEAASL